MSTRLLVQGSSDARRRGSLLRGDDHQRPSTSYDNHAKRNRRRNRRHGKAEGGKDSLNGHTAPVAPEVDGWVSVDPDNRPVDESNRWGGIDESAWTRPPSKPQTMEDILAHQAHLHEDLLRDLVPYWLKGMEAAERGEELKLEVFLNQKIAERKATGWYWTQSDLDKEEKQQGDGWSNHKASNHDPGDDNGWGPNAEVWGDSPAATWGLTGNDDDGTGNGQARRTGNDGDGWVQWTEKRKGGWNQHDRRNQYRRRNDEERGRRGRQRGY
ncbi:hypothetical protein CC1G_01732 [Coprinopsis cinerea okayama7|uniref:Uncharacterized protein n=1 Tax=Coprinopsis cinerea (strain Okayama-7 / 130 / ATCC MYA-4618 / FGSC 9003) TaxID=240176 RepID=A8N2L5_COPC7|nr:hypothetical protein CC1G_01732 [Coprinopsis cinerea okayama7\|eukprot:XP_001829052.1 hypothetical protein CC1G_01732 [Coprinopsis cinerea okayama7\